MGRGRGGGIFALAHVPSTAAADAMAAAEEGAPTSFDGWGGAGECELACMASVCMSMYMHVALSMNRRLAVMLFVIDTTGLSGLQGSGLSLLEHSAACDTPDTPHVHVPRLTWHPPPKPSHTQVVCRATSVSGQTTTWEGHTPWGTWPQASSGPPPSSQHHQQCWQPARPNGSLHCHTAPPGRRHRHGQQQQEQQQRWQVVAAAAAGMAAATARVVAGRGHGALAGRQVVGVLTEFGLRASVGFGTSCCMCSSACWNHPHIVPTQQNVPALLVSLSAAGLAVVAATPLVLPSYPQRARASSSTTSSSTTQVVAVLGQLLCSRYQPWLPTQQNSSSSRCCRGHRLLQVSGRGRLAWATSSSSSSRGQAAAAVRRSSHLVVTIHCRGEEGFNCGGSGVWFCSQWDRSGTGIYLRTEIRARQDVESFKL
jgi:hypothetical protein